MKVKKKAKKSKLFITTLTCLLILIFTFLILLLIKLNVFTNNNSQNLNNGSKINGINLSGMSKAEAYETVSTYLKNKADDFTLTLNYKDRIYTLDNDDYTINKDINTIIDMVNNKSEYANQLNSLNYFIQNGNSVNVAFNYIFQGLSDKIEEICSEIETPAVNSEIIFSPENEEMFKITESKLGYTVNRAKLYDEINKQFLKTNNVLINLELEETKATITEEYNKSLTNKIVEFSTNVSDSTGGRKNNVKLALSKFNGFILNPGQSVSFNEVTGPHTLENGYQIATIIYKGRFVDGIGGGICQASTTLYNALLLSGVTIDEVHKHTLPVKYVPLALDAMVTEGGADLRFTNNTENPIFIKTSYTADDVKVEIFSKPNEDKISYNTRSETLKTLDALPDKIVPDTNKEYTDKVLFKGETYRLTYGRVGYEVNSYLQKYKDGKMLNEELIRHEIYQPQAGIIIEGTEEPLPNIPIIEETNNSIIYDPFLLNSTLPSNICP